MPDGDVVTVSKDAWYAITRIIRAHARCERDDVAGCLVRYGYPDINDAGLVLLASAIEDMEAL